MKNKRKDIFDNRIIRAFSYVVLSVVVVFFLSGICWLIARGRFSQMYRLLFVYFGAPGVVSAAIAILTNLDVKSKQDLEWGFGIFIYYGTAFLAKIGERIFDFETKRDALFVSGLLTCALAYWIYIANFKSSD